MNNPTTKSYPSWAIAKGIYKKPMLEFMAAVYNEKSVIRPFIHDIWNTVDKVNIVDDVSTDGTWEELFDIRFGQGLRKLNIDRMPEHTGLPETVKKHALSLCDPNSWVIMLDADERFAPGVLEQIKEFVESPMADEYTHVWFTLNEYIDGQYAGRTFLKCRLFRARDAHFSETVHVDDWFDGQGANFGWVVNHSKTRKKQEMREREYLETYDKLVDEGKMTPGERDNARSMHYFIK